jgi:hypothetical protein
MLRTALLVFGSVALAGCGGPTDAPVATNSPVPPVAPAAPPPAPELPFAQPPAAKPPDPLPLPTDAGGVAVGKALMPAVPGSPEPPTAKAPRPRVTDFDRGELSLPRVVGPLPPPPAARGKPLTPSPPAEHPPRSLGDAAAVGADAFPLPDRPLVRAAGPANPGAADVPALARQLPDRASVEDPTVDLSAQGVIRTPLPLPAASLPFLREVIPNPFELAEQLKGKLGRDAEFGTAPVAVPPEKR